MLVSLAKRKGKSLLVINSRPFLPSNCIFFCSCLISWIYSLKEKCAPPACPEVQPQVGSHPVLGLCFSSCAAPHRSSPLTASAAANPAPEGSSKAKIHLCHQNPAGTPKEGSRWRFGSVLESQNPRIPRAGVLPKHTKPRSTVIVSIRNGRFPSPALFKMPFFLPALPLMSFNYLPPPPHPP